MYVVLSQEDGILGDVSLFTDQQKALTHGYHKFLEISADATGMENDPDYDPAWYGIARGYVMAWTGDSWDVWVTEAEERD